MKQYNNLTKMLVAEHGTLVSALFLCWLQAKSLVHRLWGWQTALHLRAHFGCRGFADFALGRGFSSQGVDEGTGLQAWGGWLAGSRSGLWQGWESLLSTGRNCTFENQLGLNVAGFGWGLLLHKWTRADMFALEIWQATLVLPNMQWSCMFWRIMWMVQAVQAQPETSLTVGMVRTAIKRMKQHDHDSKQGVSNSQACQQAWQVHYELCNATPYLMA